MKTVKKLDFEKLHREMWGWLAKSGVGTKSKWPGWETYEKFAPCQNHCFACEFTYSKSVGKQNCIKCPIDWGSVVDSDYIQNGVSQYCQCEKGHNSLYSKWDDCDNEDKRKEFAKQIAKMPWNPKADRTKPEIENTDSLKLKEFIEEVKIRMESIGNERDKINELIVEMSELKENCDDALDSLENARDSLSELV